MGKGHLTALDVAASSKELSIALAGCRLTNVYDLNPRTYLFKFGRPGGYKAFLIVESGVRYHLTAFERETGPLPNAFCMKLRKHLRTKRLEGVRQCGFDRILQLTFGTGDHSNHVFIELHSGGNIILTDSSLKIINLLRPYETTSAGKVAVHERYPIEQAIELKESPSSDVDETKSVLSVCTSQGLPKQLVIHCLTEAGIGNDSKATCDNVCLIYKKCYEVVVSLRALDTPTKGFLFKKDGKNVEFSPTLFNEHQLYQESEIFPSFNEAMDAFFSTLESIQKVQQSAKNEWKALSKEEKMRRDLDQRINKLEAVSERNAHLAALVEDNLDLVDSIINALRTEIASGASWTELERTVAEEKQHSQNPIASSIKSLHFDKNSVVVVLGPENTPVEIDLGISAHANANNYYGARKKAKNKSERTIAASETAMKSARLQAQKDLKKAVKKGTVGAQALSVRRKVLWFEKFQWFITSDNFLVIGGRDAQQNEMVVRRHLDPNDLYFHADLHGASSVILKNPDSINPIPERSLIEAAHFTVCNSAAWTNKAIGSAYWVRADQVSKTAPTGMYVSTGSFMVRGKRNYIPCSQLLLGFTFLFRVTDNCIEAHKDERSVAEQDQEFQDRPTFDNISGIYLANNRRAESDCELDQKSDDVTVDLRVQDLAIGASARDSSPISNNGNPEVDRALSVGSSAQSSDNENFDHSRAHEIADKTDSKPASLVKPEDTRVIESFDVTGSLLFPVNASDNDPPSYNTNLFSGSTNNQSGGGRISAKQRRQIKKGGKPLIETPSEQQVPESKPKLSTTQLPRGKRSKLKKIKTKYAHQDDFDRQLAFQWFGASAVKELQNDNPKSGSDDEGDDEPVAVVEEPNAGQVEAQDWIVKICFYCHSQGHVARACPQLAGFDKTQINKIVQQGQDRDREEDRKIVRDDADEQFNLRCLVGCPIESDEILYALPMCAPYTAIMNYKFKIKVIPGVDKRGTAAKSCMSLCMRMVQGDSDIDRIQNLLKAVSDNELANVLPPTSKVSAPGIGSNKGGNNNSKKPGQKRPKKRTRVRRLS